ncbi:MAG: hypothetical protein AB1Z23_07550 [Eubacteriales bacterium]
MRSKKSTDSGALNASGAYTQGLRWDPIQADFNWLNEEINEGNKGKRAFIIGWFNCYDCFGQCIQLGTGKGSKPLADTNKIDYFLF